MKKYNYYDLVGYSGPCLNQCGRMAEHKHHKFPQTKKNRSLYPDLIDHPENTQYLCSVCHLNKSVKHWTEKEFCDNFKIDPRSKSGKQKWLK